MLILLTGWLLEKICFDHFFYEDDFYFVEVAPNQFSLEPNLEIGTLLLLLK